MSYFNLGSNFHKKSCLWLLKATIKFCYKSENFVLDFGNLVRFLANTHTDIFRLKDT